MEEKERITKLEIQVSENKARIERHEEKISKLSDVYIALTKVTDKVDNVEKDISEVKSDIKEIKEKPAKKWESVVSQIISILVATIAGYFLAKVGLK